MPDFSVKMKLAEAVVFAETTRDLGAEVRALLGCVSTVDPNEVVLLLSAAGRLLETHAGLCEQYIDDFTRCAQQLWDESDDDDEGCVDGQVD